MKIHGQIVTYYFFVLVPGTSIDAWISGGYGFELE